MSASHYKHVDADNVPSCLTPFIVTFSEGTLTAIDIQKFIEMGLRIIRFKMVHITTSDKLKLLAMVHKAVKWLCEKYDVTTWPIATCVDISNGLIKTGYLAEEIYQQRVLLKVDSLIEVTSQVEYWNRCCNTRVFIDDPFTIDNITTGTEVTINFGEIVMICVGRISPKTITCKVVKEGHIESNEYVCVRGVKHTKPPLTKGDLEIVEFVNNFGIDIVTINAVRSAEILLKVKQLFNKNRMPLIMSTICEQEGLDNIDEIIQLSDGIILAREFLAYELVNNHQVTAIQLHIGAKCRMLGKPFYIAGNILEKTLLLGSIAPCDITDITNAILQGAGFVLKAYSDPSKVLEAMNVLNSTCQSVEPLIKGADDFWKLCDSFKLPVNAAEGCVIACALCAKQCEASAIILHTVTGRTAVQMASMSPEAVILTTSNNPTVARKLQLYRGIISILYDKKHKKDWHDEMQSRVEFALTYGVKKNILKYGNTYVTLQKSSPVSAYCDCVRIWKITTKASIKEC